MLTASFVPRRSYFFDENNRPCPHYHRSVVTSAFSATIQNSFGEHWQDLAENLQKLAHIHGQVVRVDLSAENPNQAIIRFTIHFDNAHGGMKMFQHHHQLNLVTGTEQFMNMSYT